MVASYRGLEGTAQSSTERGGLTVVRHGDNVVQDTNGINFSLSIFFLNVIERTFLEAPCEALANCRWKPAPWRCVFFFSISITHPLPPALATTNSLWPRHDLRCPGELGCLIFSFFPEQKEWTIWLLLRWRHKRVCHAIDCEKQFKSHTRALGAERNMNVRKWGDMQSLIIVIYPWASDHAQDYIAGR